MTPSDFIRPSIKSITPYSSARDEFKGKSDSMIFMDANESPFENGINRYPDPQQNKLKQVISNLKGIPAENIMLGNGSDEILDLLIRIFCEPNQDNVVILPPTYGMYEVLATLNAVEIKKINLLTTFQPDVNRILQQANDNNKILFLCSPNNPTGNNFEVSDIETLLQGFKGIVVIDEAYIDFSQQESWTKRLQEFPNLVVTQTLSKAYGMAGIRLGTCYASKEIISTLNKIKPPYNINQLTQHVAIENLKSEFETKNHIQTILKEKHHLTEELEQLNFVKKVFPSDANFILIKVDDANERYKQLLKNGIIIRNRSNQELCENCLRITIGTPEENQQLISVLKSL